MIAEGRIPSYFKLQPRRFTMNNCLCSMFDNNNWIWIILVILLFTCCCGC